MVGSGIPGDTFEDMSRTEGGVPHPHILCTPPHLDLPVRLIFPIGEEIRYIHAMVHAMQKNKNSLEDSPVPDERGRP